MFRSSMIFQVPVHSMIWSCDHSVIMLSNAQSAASAYVVMISDNFPLVYIVLRSVRMFSISQTSFVNTSLLPTKLYLLFSSSSCFSLSTDRDTFSSASTMDHGWPWMVCQAWRAHTYTIRDFPEYEPVQQEMNARMSVGLAGHCSGSGIIHWSQKTW